MNPIRAALAYDTKLTAAGTEALLVALKPAMVVAYGTSAVAAYALENQVKGVLELVVAPAPIPTPDYPIYYAFARQILRKSRRFPGGPGLTTEIGYLITTYTARGCNAAALAAIKVAMGY
jgi:hypothetical protein